MGYFWLVAVSHVQEIDLQSQIPHNKRFNFAELEFLEHRHPLLRRETMPRVLMFVFLAAVAWEATAQGGDTRRFETDLQSGAVTMWSKGTNIWTYMPQGEEGKPFFPSLTVPGSGEALTACHPPDHVWHLGLWFSWKFINEYNFWEPHSNALTRVVKQNVATGADKILMAEAQIAYRGNNIELLREERTVRVVTELNGDYLIEWEGRFTAQNQSVTLACTPAARDKSGDWAVGGYAGLVWRFADNSAFEHQFTNAAGREGIKACGEASEWVEILSKSKVSGACARIRFTDLSGSPRHPTPWFVRYDKNALKGRGYYCVGPAPLFHKPLQLAAGESFTLRYSIAVKREM